MRDQRQIDGVPASLRATGILASGYDHDSDLKTVTIISLSYSVYTYTQTLSVTLTEFSIFSLLL